MIQRVHCYECGSADMTLPTSVTVVAPQRCGACHQTHSRQLALSFCSPLCMVNYMREKGGEVDMLAERMAKEENWPYNGKPGEPVRNLLEDLPQAEPQTRPLRRQE